MTATVSPETEAETTIERFNETVPTVPDWFTADRFNAAIKALQDSLQVESVPLVREHFRRFHDEAVEMLRDSVEYERVQLLKTRLAGVKSDSEQAEAAEQDARKAFEDAIAACDDAASVKARQQWTAARSIHNPEAFKTETDTLKRMIEDAKPNLQRRWLYCLEQARSALQQRLTAESAASRAAIRSVFTGTILTQLQAVHASDGVLNVIGTKLEDFEAWQRGTKRTQPGVALDLMPFLGYQGSLIDLPANL